MMKINNVIKKGSGSKRTIRMRSGGVFAVALGLLTLSANSAHANGGTSNHQGAGSYEDNTDWDSLGAVSGTHQMGKTYRGWCNTGNDFDYIRIRNTSGNGWIDCNVQCFPTQAIDPEQVEIVLFDNNMQQIGGSTKVSDPKTGKCNFRVWYPTNQHYYYICVKMKNNWHGSPVGWCCDTNPRWDSWTPQKEYALSYYQYYATYGYWEYAYAYWYYFQGLGDYEYYTAVEDPALSQYSLYAGYAQFYLYSYNSYYFYYLYIAYAYYYYFAALGDYNSAGSYYNAYSSAALAY